MSPSNYDIGQIEGWRRNGKTWQYICDKYSVTYPAAMRWYKRYLLKLSKQAEELVPITVDISSGKIQKVELLKLTDKPPTGYISKLSHTEWANKYTPSYWDYEYLDELSDFIWEEKKGFAFLPRLHGKTMRIIALFCRYLLEEKRTILCITGGPANLRRIWREVRRIMQSNLVLEDYGNVVPYWNGSTREAEFHPSIEVVGLDPAFAIVTRQGDIAGRHPSWVHLEDLIQEPFRSHESNVFLRDWFTGIVELTISRKKVRGGRLTGTGTRKTLNDFYAFVLEELRYKSIVRQATTLISGEYPSIGEVYEDKDGNDAVHMGDAVIETLGCEDWPLEELIMYRILAPLKYEAEMQNNPLPSTGTYFDPADMQFYESLPPAHQCRVSISADPSFGRKTGSDYTAIVVIAWHIPMDRFYVLEHFFKLSMTYNDIIDQITQTFIKWSNLGFPIQSISCESNLYQMWLIDGFKGIPIPIEGIDNQQNKIERICTLNPIFRRNMLFFNENLPGFRQMLAQITQFDQTASTATKKDDGLDAMQTAIQQLQIVTHTTSKGYATS